MICFPNAKINLGLNIVSQREDGYHNIETLFYPIGLSDALEVLPSDNYKPYQLFQTGIDIRSSSENNLVIKALNLLAAERIIPNIDIHLFKNIPFGAGLGGGSSDGVFMLTLLNRMFSLGYSDKELQRFAIKLGADCSFFLINKPSFASGIGEQLEPIDLSLDSYYFILVKPNVYVSTKEAYSRISARQPKQSIKEIINLPITEWRYNLFNDFETPVFDKYPEIKEIKQTLYECGALYASMSGSGSSVYGFFKEKPVVKFDNCFIWTNF